MATRTADVRVQADYDEASEFATLGPMDFEVFPAERTAPEKLEPYQHPQSKKLKKTHRIQIGAYIGLSTVPARLMEPTVEDERMEDVNEPSPPVLKRSRGGMGKISTRAPKEAEQ